MLDISIHQIKSITVKSNALSSGTEVKTLLITTEDSEHTITMFANSIESLEIKTEEK